MWAYPWIGRLPMRPLRDALLTRRRSRQRCGEWRKRKGGTVTRLVRASPGRVMMGAVVGRETGTALEHVPG